MNATFIITSVIDQHCASFVRFFLLIFLSIQMKLSSMCLLTLHPGISNSKNGTNPCSPTSSRKMWKNTFMLLTITTIRSEVWWNTTKWTILWKDWLLLEMPSAKHSFGYLICGLLDSVCFVLLTNISKLFSLNLRSGTRNG